MNLWDLLSWEHWARSVLGNWHLLAALTALLLGPVVLLRRKGDTLHRWLGRVWALIMLGVDVSALLLYDFTGRPNLFHFFALLSLSALIPGVLGIRRYRQTGKAQDLKTHQICMCWAYIGLVFAGVWQVATRVLLILEVMAYGQALMLLGLLTFVVSWWLNRLLTRRYGVAAPTSGYPI